MAKKQELTGWAIRPPEGFDEDYPAANSFAGDAESAWARFCFPALRREAYEADGFRPVKVKVTIEELPVAQLAKAREASHV